ncbi:MAG: nicotinate-nucleotide--dimethylbenzimidazole phosphoribosyltransferase, partial [Firmicutes bacterium]|nr:nicotinate-nucleotide--dimethylbenzimidazole phosphoribosyltransferase [Bacillota bacterium]
KNAGYDILGIGEMGIGNTTTSAAVLSAVTGAGSDATCGKGGGINDKSFVRKKEIVDEVSTDWRAKGGLLAVLEEVRDQGGSPIDDMVGILASMGGFDICAMTGAFIGAAANKIPVVIDGYISVVAALAAYVMAPKSVGYMFASHKSWEKGYELAVEALGLKPFLELGMRLGEGSGCPIAFQVIKGACDVMRNMATFEEAEINDDYLDEIRKGDCF